MADYPNKDQNAAQDFENGFNNATARKKKKPEDEQSAASTALEMMGMATDGASDMASEAMKAMGLKKKK